jgi:hypothetical protein
MIDRSQWWELSGEGPSEINFDLLEYFVDGNAGRYKEVEVHIEVEHVVSTRVLGAKSYVIDGAEELSHGIFIRTNYSHYENKDGDIKVETGDRGRFAVHLCGGARHCVSGKYPGWATLHPLRVRRTRWGTLPQERRSLPVRSRVVGDRPRETEVAGAAGGALVLAGGGDGRDRDGDGRRPAPGGAPNRVEATLRALEPLPAAGGATRAGGRFFDDEREPGGPIDDDPGTTPAGSVRGGGPKVDGDKPGMPPAQVEELKKKLQQARAKLPPKDDDKPQGTIGFFTELQTRTNAYFDKLLARAKQKKEDRRRQRARRRRGRDSRSPSHGEDDVSSSSSTSTDLEEVFRRSRRSGKDLADLAKRAPGLLTRTMIRRIRDYLQTHRATTSAEELDTNTSVFWQTVMMPQTSGMPPRSQRELRTAFFLMDLLLAGKTVEALDTLSQRIKAIETASEEVHWGGASLMELVPDSNMSLRSMGERAQVARTQRDTARLLGAHPRGRSRSRSPGHGRTE